MGDMRQALLSLLCVATAASLRLGPPPEKARGYHADNTPKPDLAKIGRLKTHAVADGEAAEKFVEGKLDCCPCQPNWSGTKDWADEYKDDHKLFYTAGGFLQVADRQQQQTAVTQQKKGFLDKVGKVAGDVAAGAGKVGDVAEKAGDVACGLGMDKFCDAAKKAAAAAKKVEDTAGKVGDVANQAKGALNKAKDLFVSAKNIPAMLKKEFVAMDKPVVKMEMPGNPPEPKPEGPPAKVSRIKRSYWWPLKYARHATKCCSCAPLGGYLSDPRELTHASSTPRTLDSLHMHLFEHHPNEAKPELPKPDDPDKPDPMPKYTP